MPCPAHPQPRGGQRLRQLCHIPGALSPGSPVLSGAPCTLQQPRCVLASMPASSRQLAAAHRAALPCLRLACASMLAGVCGQALCVCRPVCSRWWQARPVSVVCSPHVGFELVAHPSLRGSPLQFSEVPRLSSRLSYVTLFLWCSDVWGRLQSSLGGLQ